jgi:Uri superfamily endonuclease
MRRLQAVRNVGLVQPHMDLARDIERPAPGAAPIDGAAVESMAPARGAYVLVMRLAAPVSFARRNIAPATLSGSLVYVGSARGSGGIRARLLHHFRQGKLVHWHVDELTNVAAQITALALVDDSECAIVERLVLSGRFAPALAGFGSSDCTRCVAHLLVPVQG